MIPSSLSHDLGLVTELDRFPEAAFTRLDGRRVRVTTRAVLLLAALSTINAGAGLDDELGRVRSASTASSSSDDARHASGAVIDVDAFVGFGERRLREIGQQPSDHKDFGLRFVGPAAKPHTDLVLYDDGPATSDR